MIGLTALAIGMVALCVGAVAYQYYYNDRAIRRRMLRAAQRVSIADAPERKLIKIVGRLEFLDDPITAALSERPCAFYEATVEQSRGDFGWQVLIREARGCRFVIRDGTGVAIVDPSYAHAVTVHDKDTRSGYFRGATPPEEELLARHGHKSHGWLHEKELRYREGVLEEGEEVAVLGYGVREPAVGTVAEDGGYREGPAMQLIMTGSARRPLLLSDEPDNMGQLALPAPGESDAP